MNNGSQETAQTAADPKVAADEALKEAQRRLQERLGPQFKEAQARLTETNERVKKFVRENPGTCLLGAAAVGFLIGRWAARR
jgi:ElaB/YqjD/DUF883 family membrane-anchored ribosome-binding protein